MTDDRLRDLVTLSHEADAPPGFAATLRAAGAAAEPEPVRRKRPLLAVGAALAAAGIAALAWMADRDRRPPAQPALVAPALDQPGPFDQLPSPFPGQAVADLIEDRW